MGRDRRDDKPFAPGSGDSAQPDTQQRGGYE